MGGAIPFSGTLTMCAAGTMTELVVVVVFTVCPTHEAALPLPYLTYDLGECYTFFLVPLMCATETMPRPVVDLHCCVV